MSLWFEWIYPREYSTEGTTNQGPDSEDKKL